MTRYANPVPQYFDSKGKELSGGKLYFYDSGSATKKKIWADPAFMVEQPNPIILFGDGRVPSIFLKGSYRVVLTDKDDLVIWERDPVSGAQGVQFGADWSSIIAYNVGDVVRESDRYWISLTGGNTNNRPSTDGGANWEEIVFYQTGEVVGSLENYDEVRALNGSNFTQVSVAGHTTACDGGGGGFCADLADSTSTDNGATILVSADGTRWKRIFDGVVHVGWFGAVGDGVSDDAPAIQAAVNYALASGVKVVQLGSLHLLGSGIDISNTGGLRYEIKGGGAIESTKIICDYNGYGSGASDGFVFRFGDESSPSYQTSVGFSGLLFTKGPNCDRAPIGILGASLAQSRIDNITFGAWNNTGIALNTPQNVRGQDITTFGCGLSFGYKDASSVTVSQSGTTLTATGSIFSASDVGKTVAIWGTGGSTYRRKAVITAYISPTQVTVAKSVTDATARSLYFGSPFCSITSGATTLNADAACFTADHVGLFVWVKGAGVNSGLLRAKIVAYNSSTSVELDTTASTTTTTSEIGVAAVEIYSDPAISNGASDIRFTGVQIEDHNGIGLCVSDADILHIDGKIHGEQTISTYDDYSLSTIWADRWAGTYSGDFDAQYVGENRSWFGNQTGTLVIPSLHTRTARDEVIAHISDRSPTFEGASVIFGDLSIIGDSSSSILHGEIITDSNAPIPGYGIAGAVTRQEFDLTKYYLGNGVSADYGGGLEALSISFGDSALSEYSGYQSFTPVVADAASGGNTATGTFSAHYERIGNIVTAHFDLRSINTSGMTAGNNLYIRGLPVPVRGGTTNRFVGNVRVDNVTFGGFLTAYADDADTYLLIYSNTTGAASNTLKVSSISSGVSNIFLSITYVA